MNIEEQLPESNQQEMGNLSRKSVSVNVKKSNQLLVLMTTHNNLGQLKESLGCLSVASQRAQLTSHVLIANSGALTEIKPRDLKNLIIDEFSTPSDTFWARGMRNAWVKSQDLGIVFDWVLWLNDDTFLDADAINKLMFSLDGDNGSIIRIGATRTHLGTVSYGGLNQKSFFAPLHFQKLSESNSYQPCDTFNGNIVLVGHKFFSKMGGFPKGYTHLRADLEFGLQAKRRKYESVVVPGTLGKCEENFGYKSYSSLRGMSLIARFKELNSPKFGPLSEHVSFSLKHGGFLGPIYALAPIIRSLLAR
jgi:hypothetical protein